VLTATNFSLTVAFMAPLMMMRMIYMVMSDGAIDYKGLKEEVDRLAQPPSGYGVFLATAGIPLRIAGKPDDAITSTNSINDKIMGHFVATISAHRNFSREMRFDMA
jgi:hypothetical protein